jgi:hypothetical protein
LALTSPTSGGRSVGIVRTCGLKPRSSFSEEVSKFFFQVCYLMMSVLREYTIDITMNENGEIGGM